MEFITTCGFIDLAVEFSLETAEELVSLPCELGQPQRNLLEYGFPLLVRLL